MAKKAIVTGGSGDIGKGIVTAFAKEGYDVVFSYNTHEEKALAAVEELQKTGVRVAAFRCDLRNFAMAQSFMMQAKEFLTDVDVLVNNAGIIKDRPFFLMSEQEWHDVIGVNLNGYFNATRNIIGHFYKRKKGCIINVASVSAFKGVEGQVNYCAAKAGVVGFTLALAKEAAKAGVRVNAIAPGYIKSDMVDAIPEKAFETVLNSIPMKRLGTVQDVAEMIVFLSSDKASYVTGQVFTVDGGFSL